MEQAGRSGSLVAGRPWHTTPREGTKRVERTASLLLACDQKLVIHALRSVAFHTSLVIVEAETTLRALCRLHILGKRVVPLDFLGGHRLSRVRHGLLKVRLRDVRHRVWDLLVLTRRLDLPAVNGRLPGLLGGDRFPNRILRRPLADLGDVRTGEAVRGPGKLVEVHVRSEGRLAQVRSEDGPPRVQIRKRDVHQLVEPPRPRHRGIHDVGPVGRADDEDVLSATHSVDLGEDLVEDAVSGLRAAGTAGTACLRDRVHLIEEQDARRRGAGLVEEVAHVRLGLAEPHGEQLRALDADEVRPAFVGDGLGQEGLATARGAVEEHALGRVHAELAELVCVLHGVLHRLAQLALHVLQATDVGPGHLRHFDEVLAKRGRSDVTQRPPEVLLLDAQVVHDLLRQVLGVDVDLLDLRANGLQGRFHAELAQVRADEAVRVLCDLLQVHVLCELHALGLDLQDLVPAFVVGHADVELPVEASEAAQRGLDHVRAVGGRDHDHVAAGLDAVHERQELRHDALLHLPAGLVPLGRDRVDLVDEDDGRALLLGILEGLAQPRLRLAGQLGHDLRAVDGEDERVGLGRHRPGEHGLAGSRRAVEQHAAGRWHSDGAEDLRVLQRQLDELADGSQLLLQAANVVVADLVEALVVLGARDGAVDVQGGVGMDHRRIHLFVLVVEDAHDLEFHGAVRLCDLEEIPLAQGGLALREVRLDEDLVEVGVDLHALHGVVKGLDHHLGRELELRRRHHADFLVGTDAKVASPRGAERHSILRQRTVGQHHRVGVLSAAAAQPHVVPVEEPLGLHGGRVQRAHVVLFTGGLLGSQASSRLGLLEAGRRLLLLVRTGVVRRGRRGRLALLGLLLLLLGRLSLVILHTDGAGAQALQAEAAGRVRPHCGARRAPAHAAALDWREGRERAQEQRERGTQQRMHVVAR
eukprot:scaffold3330_cov398-Pinguiococcus_pyrenoidosus.AAC.3